MGTDHTQNAKTTIRELLPQDEQPPMILQATIAMASKIVSPGAKKERPEIVEGLARGLAVIEVFSQRMTSMTLTEVANRTSLTRASARRILRTLMMLGYLKEENSRFSLQPRILKLASAYLSGLRWWQVGRPYLENVANETQSSCSAAVLDGLDIVYVACVPTTRMAAVNVRFGTRFPAMATAMGRVLAADLDEDELKKFLHKAALERITNKTNVDPSRLRRILLEVRSKGHCLIDEETELGVRSLAVPIKSTTGQVIAAMEVATTISYASRQMMINKMLPKLSKASREITAVTGAG